RIAVVSDGPPHLVRLVVGSLVDVRGPVRQGALALLPLRVVLFVPVAVAVAVVAAVGVVPVPLGPVVGRIPPADVRVVLLVAVVGGPVPLGWVVIRGAVPAAGLLGAAPARQL